MKGALTSCLIGEMDVALAGEVAQLLLGSGDGWAAVTEKLATAASADSAVVVMAGTLSRPLGGVGRLPPDISHSADATLVQRALTRVGLQTVWTRSLRDASRSLGVVAVAAERAEAFGPEVVAGLDAVLPVVGLGLRVELENERREAEVGARWLLARRIEELHRFYVLGAIASVVTRDLEVSVRHLADHQSDARARPVGLSESLRRESDSDDDSRRGEISAPSALPIDRVRALLAELTLAARFAVPSVSEAGPLDVAEILRHCFSLVAPLARGTVTLALAIAPGLPTIAGRSRRLEQALVNLLVNAVQAAAARPGGGHVRVSLGRDGRELLVRFADDGPSTGRGLRDRLFDQLHALRPYELAAGLGHLVAREIVESHGGGVDTEVYDRDGAEVRVRLPIPSVSVER